MSHEDGGGEDVDGSLRAAWVEGRAAKASSVRWMRLPASPRLDRVKAPARSNAAAQIPDVALPPLAATARGIIAAYA